MTSIFPSSSRGLAAISLLLVPLAASLAGCSVGLDLSGDWSEGERGRTRWQIDDGLCPGFGGCALDVPLALGARPRIHVEGVDGRRVTAAGDEIVSVTDYDVLSGDDADPFFEISASAAGTGTLSLLDASGDEVDRARVQVREATALDCGVIPTGEPVRWDAPDLVPTSRVVLPIPAVDPETGEREAHAFQLVCRARDEAGPLLSVAAISWEVLEGDDVLELRNDGLFLFSGSVVRGARIRYETLAPGAARIRASIGSVTQELDVTVE